MAFIDLQNEEEEEARNEQDQPQLSREPGVISGSSVAARPGTKQSDTNFTNVNQYIEANKEGIGRMAGDISGGIKSQVGKAEADLDKSLGQFKGQQRVIGDYSDIASALGREGGVLGLTDQQKGTVRELASSGYQPSTDLGSSENYQKALQEKQKALGLLTLAGNEAGTGTLIKETMKPEQYSRGEMALDVGLLRTEPGARQTFNQLASQRPEFETRLKSKATEAADFAANQRRQYEAAQAAIRQAGTGRFETLRAADSPEAIAARRNQAFEQAKAAQAEQRARAEQMHKESLVYDPEWDLGQYQLDVTPEAFGGITTTLSDDQLQELIALNEILGINQDLPQRVEAGFRAPSTFNMEAFERDLQDYIFETPNINTNAGISYAPSAPIVRRRNQAERVQNQPAQAQDFGGTVQAGTANLPGYSGTEQAPQRNRDNRRVAQIPIISNWF